MKCILKIYFTCLLFLGVNCFAQTSHLANGGFETTICCPTSSNEFYSPPYCVKPWFSLKMGLETPDNYDVCSTASGLQVPDNVCGHQLPRSGNAYAGLYLYGGGSIACSEYIQAKLIDSLIAGGKYYVNFYISLCVNSKYALDGIGAYFSKDTLQSDTACHFAVQPQVENPVGNVILDTTNWVRISGSFIAAGGEKFITIGNFRDFNSIAFDTTSWGTDEASYYLIDDVSVIDSGGLEVVEPYEGSSINIYPNPGNGRFLIDSKDQIKDLCVFSLLGEEIYNMKINKQKVEVNISGQPKGIYFLHLKTEKGIAVRKIVIQ